MFFHKYFSIVCHWWYYTQTYNLNSYTLIRQSGEYYLFSILSGKDNYGMRFKWLLSLWVQATYMLNREIGLKKALKEEHVFF